MYVLLSSVRIGEVLILILSVDMTIETKYNIGDKLWTLDDNKVTCFTVSKIDTFTTVDSVAATVEGTVIGQKISKPIMYGGSNTGMHYESECFPTKEELINSL